MVRNTRQILWVSLVFMMGLALFSGAAGVRASDADSQNQASVQTISVEMFRNAFDQFIFRQQDLASADVVISKFKVVRNGPVPAGDVDIQLLRINNRPLSRYVRVKAVVSVNGIPVNNAEVCAWLDVFESVVCAGKDLPQGHVLKKKDLSLVRQNISKNMDDVVKDADLVVGFMAKRSIRKGDMVTHWMVEKKPVVNRGDQVTILVESGLLRVTIPGKVLDDGFAGETVSVENSMSNKKIFARVIDEVTVRVDI